MLLSAFVGVSVLLSNYSIVSCVLLVAAMSGDWRAGRNRDWTHWLGFVLMFVGFAAAAGTWLWGQLSNAPAAP